MRARDHAPVLSAGDKSLLVISSAVTLLEKKLQRAFRREGTTVPVRVCGRPGAGSNSFLHGAYQGGL